MFVSKLIGSTIGNVGDVDVGVLVVGEDDVGSIVVDDKVVGSCVDTISSITSSVGSSVDGEEEGGISIQKSSFSFLIKIHRPVSSISFKHFFLFSLLHDGGVGDGVGMFVVGDVEGGGTLAALVVGTGLTGDDVVGSSLDGASLDGLPVVGDNDVGLFVLEIVSTKPAIF